ncbi:MAG TPA: FRG domain-containing protein [Anaerolineae bacterium]|nr:FRG domain-containing protein [Anaerolineae bacterium]HMR63183.1 FRG domain-containing protein [Anaerolineae bacterium]
MNEVWVKSWNDLLDILYAGAWSPTLQRYRSPFAFRGVSDRGYRLETTLRRLGGDFVKVEPHLLRNFRKYAHRDVVEGDTIWHWLSVAQHHGLPTRLLDWTYSPFVALHFATANLNKFELDGVVWMVNFVEVHRHLPDLLRLELDSLGAHAFDVEMLSARLASLASLDTICPTPFALFFEPPSLDDRIVNQFALFSILSSPTAVLEDWLQAIKVTCSKVIIPAGLKWEIRDKLDQANITERVLFPGLDGLSTWLKRHYSPKVG